MGKRQKNRYDTLGLIENQFEPGSGKRVLKNLIGIKSKRRMDQMEAHEYAATFEHAIRLYGKSHRFSADDLCDLHKIWLGKFYVWAGTYRMVNVVKGNFHFAAAQYVPLLMDEFGKKVLSCRTPCISQKMATVVEALAVVHVELVLIHPFREGNGRLARLLAVLMALQAGLPALNFDCIRGRKRQEYFAAIRKGLDKNYLPMEAIFREVIERSFRSAL